MSGVVFQDVWIDNFMAIGQARVKLSERGLVFIEGENLDDPSAASNGAGKSSLVDAISWCLYGVTARGVTGDAVVNRKAGKGCEVSIEVEVDGVLFKVERGRKHKTLKNRVRLFKHDPAEATWDDLTLGTDKLTQELIDSLLGCNAKTFNDAVYMGQERMTDLPGMTDKLLKATLEQALSLDRLDEALSIANLRLDNAKVSTRARMNDLEECRDDLTNIDDDVAAKVTQAKNLEVDMDSIKKELGEAVSNHDRELARAEGALTAAEAFLNHSNSKMDETLAKLKEVKDKGAMTYLSDHKKLVEKQNELIANRVELEVAIKEHQNFLKCPTECPTCERKFEDADDLVGKKLVKQAELRDLVKAKEGIIDRIKKVEDMRTTMRDAYNGMVVSAESEVADARRDNQTRMMDVQRLKGEVTKLKTSAQVTLLNRWYKEKKDLHAALAGEIALLEQEREHLTKQAKDLLEVFEESEQRVSTLEKVKHVLSRKGFRGEVLDQVTPYLNARTQYYLTWLTSDNISAIWNTVNVTSAGDLSENFHIQVTHREGAESFDGLSGGEKRKVRLACAMALQDLVGTRAVKPIKLFIADEIDDAIDESGLELLMGLLEEKAKSVGTLLIISHNSLSDWCKESIAMVKKDGVTTIK